MDELDSSLQGAPETTEQLTELPRLERVVKESLWVLSPVPWNGRVTVQPTYLGRYDLPVGIEVFASIYESHHMPELYPQPDHGGRVGVTSKLREAAGGRSQAKLCAVLDVGGCAGNPVASGGPVIVGVARRQYTRSA
jgi:hypothetical protein